MNQARSEAYKNLSPEELQGLKDQAARTKLPVMSKEQLTEKEIKERTATLMKQLKNIVSSTFVIKFYSYFPCMLNNTE